MREYDGPRHNAPEHRLREDEYHTSGRRNRIRIPDHVAGHGTSDRQSPTHCRVYVKPAAKVELLVV